MDKYECIQNVKEPCDSEPYVQSAISTVSDDALRTPDSDDSRITEDLSRESNYLITPDLSDDGQDPVTPNSSHDAQNNPNLFEDAQDVPVLVKSELPNDFQVFETKLNTSSSTSSSTTDTQRITTSKAIKRSHECKDEEQGVSKISKIKEKSDTETVGEMSAPAQEDADENKQTPSNDKSNESSKDETKVISDEGEQLDTDEGMEEKKDVEENKQIDKENTETKAITDEGEPFEKIKETKAAEQSVEPENIGECHLCKEETEASLRAKTDKKQQKRTPNDSKKEENDMPECLLHPAGNLGNHNGGSNFMTRNVIPGPGVAMDALCVAADHELRELLKGEEVLVCNCRPEAPLGDDFTQRNRQEVALLADLPLDDDFTPRNRQEMSLYSDYLWDRLQYSIHGGVEPIHPFAHRLGLIEMPEPPSDTAPQVIEPVATTSTATEEQEATLEKIMSIPPSPASTSSELTSPENTDIEEEEPEEYHNPLYGARPALVRNSMYPTLARQAAERDHAMLLEDVTAIYNLIRMRQTEGNKSEDNHNKTRNNREPENNSQANDADGKNAEAKKKDQSAKKNTSTTGATSINTTAKNKTSNVGVSNNAATSNTATTSSNAATSSNLAVKNKIMKKRAIIKKKTKKNGGSPKKSSNELGEESSDSDASDQYSPEVSPSRGRVWRPPQRRPVQNTIRFGPPLALPGPGSSGGANVGQSATRPPRQLTADMLLEAVGATAMRATFPRARIVPQRRRNLRRRDTIPVRKASSSSDSEQSSN